MSAHSILGPSSAERWMNCPGSVAATRDLKEEPSRYAAEGTAAHQVAENCREQGRVPGSWLGQTLTIDGFNITVDDEMVRAVETFLEYTDDLQGEPLAESRVRYTGWVPEGFGTLDFAAIGETCHIVDFKYGKGVQVYAADNPQLKLYALGVLEEYGWLHPILRFRLHIVQPRLDFIDAWDISLTDLMQWATDQVRPAALLAIGENAPLQAGDWCRFCKIKATCRVRAQTVFDTAIQDFTEIGEGDTKVVAQLTPGEIAKALCQVANIKRWCSDLQHYALAARARGERIGDWKIVAGRSSRSWAYPESETAEKLLDRGLASGLIYAPPELLSPAQMEKKVGKDKLLDLVVKRPGAPTLAPGDDPRSEITLVDSEFNEVEES